MYIYAYVYTYVLGLHMYVIYTCVTYGYIYTQSVYVCVQLQQDVSS